MKQLRCHAVRSFALLTTALVLSGCSRSEVHDRDREGPEAGRPSFVDVHRAVGHLDQGLAPASVLDDPQAGRTYRDRLSRDTELVARTCGAPLEDRLRSVAERCADRMTRALDAQETSRTVVVDGALRAASEVLRGVRGGERTKRLARAAEISALEGVARVIAVAQSARGVQAGLYELAYGLRAEHEAITEVRALEGAAVFDPDASALMEELLGVARAHAPGAELRLHPPQLREETAAGHEASYVELIRAAARHRPEILRGALDAAACLLDPGGCLSNAFGGQWRRPEVVQDLGHLMLGPGDVTRGKVLDVARLTHGADHDLGRTILALELRYLDREPVWTGHTLERWPTGEAVELAIRAPHTLLSGRLVVATEEGRAELGFRGLGADSLEFRALVGALEDALAGCAYTEVDPLLERMALIDAPATETHGRRVAEGRAFLADFEAAAMSLADPCAPDLKGRVAAGHDCLSAAGPGACGADELRRRLREAEAQLSARAEVARACSRTGQRAAEAADVAALYGIHRELLARHRRLLAACPEDEERLHEAEDVLLERLRAQLARTDLAAAPPDLKVLAAWLQRWPDPRLSDAAQEFARDLARAIREAALEARTPFDAFEALVVLGHGLGLGPSALHEPFEEVVDEVLTTVGRSFPSATTAEESLPFLVGFDAQLVRIPPGAFRSRVLELVRAHLTLVIASLEGDGSPRSRLRSLAALSEVPADGKLLLLIDELLPTLGDTVAAVEATVTGDADYPDLARTLGDLQRFQRDFAADSAIDLPTEGGCATWAGDLIGGILRAQLASAREILAEARRALEAGQTTRAERLARDAMKIDRPWKGPLHMEAQLLLGSALALGGEKTDMIAGRGAIEEVLGRDHGDLAPYFAPLLARANLERARISARLGLAYVADIDAAPDRGRCRMVTQLCVTGHNEAVRDLSAALELDPEVRGADEVQARIEEVRRALEARREGLARRFGIELDLRR